MTKIRTTTRQWLLDALAAAAVAGALCLRAATPFEAQAVPPDWRAYALMVLMGGLLLVRRRYPLGVLLASIGVLMAYYSLGFGAVGAIWPVAPALFNAALLSEWKAAAWTAGFVVVSSTLWRLVFEPETDILATISDVITEMFVAVAVILAGAMILNHRLLKREIRERERAVAAERDADARSRLTEQRLHIAREIHDIVAHSLAGIGVQAHLADEVLESDTDEAHRSIRSILDATSDAMRQLRETVGNLRSAPAGSPSIKEIVNGVYGVDAELIVEGDGAPPSDETETVIRSVVREALTNVVRHSGASKARVTVTRQPDYIEVEVADDGRGGSAFVEGHGIEGMRERAASVGGTLQAGSGPMGGFRVSVTIPR